MLNLKTSPEDNLGLLLCLVNRRWVGKQNSLSLSGEGTRTEVSLLAATCVMQWIGEYKHGNWGSSVVTGNGEVGKWGFWLLSHLLGMQIFLPSCLQCPTAHGQLFQCSPAVFLDVHYGMPKSSGNWESLFLSQKQAVQFLDKTLYCGLTPTTSCLLTLSPVG